MAHNEKEEWHLGKQHLPERIKAKSRARFPEKRGAGEKCLSLRGRKDLISQMSKLM